MRALLSFFSILAITSNVVAEPRLSEHETTVIGIDSASFSNLEEYKKAVELAKQLVKKTPNAFKKTIAAGFINRAAEGNYFNYLGDKENSVTLDERSKPEVQEAFLNKQLLSEESNLHLGKGSEKVSNFIYAARPIFNWNRPGDNLNSVLILSPNSSILETIKKDLSSGYGYGVPSPTNDEDFPYFLYSNHPTSLPAFLITTDGNLTNEQKKTISFLRDKGVRIVLSNEEDSANKLISQNIVSKIKSHLTSRIDHDFFIYHDHETLKKKPNDNVLGDDVFDDIVETHKKELKDIQDKASAFSKNLHAEIGSTEQTLTNYTDGIKSGKISLDQAIAQHAQVLGSLKGLYGTGLLANLEKYNVLIERYKRFKEVELSKWINDRIEELKKAREELESYKQYLSAKDYGRLSSMIDIQLEEAQTSLGEWTAFEKTIPTQEEIFGKDSESFFKNFNSLKKKYLVNLHNVIRERFGAEGAKRLMEEGAKAGFYYDNSSGGYVYSGDAGGGSGGHGGSSLGSSSSISGLGGAGISSAHKSNGRLSFYLSNGNLININEKDIVRMGKYSFFRYQNGFLIIEADYNGQMKEVFYFSDDQLVKLGEELASLRDNPEIVAKLVTKDLGYCAKKARVGVMAGSDLIKYATKDDHSGSIIQDDTKKYNEEILSYCQAVDADVESIISRNTTVLNMYPKDLWPVILKLMYGPEDQNRSKDLEGLPQKDSKLSKGESAYLPHLGHTAVSLAELYLGKKALFPGQAAEGAVKKSLGRRLLGRALRWGTGSALLYDAGKRAWMVWGRDTNPTWSPLVTGISYNFTNKAREISNGALFKKNAKKWQVTPEELQKRIEN